MKKTSNKPCDFVIFGAWGDLCRRKLITSLYQLEKLNMIATDTRIIGVARREGDNQTFIDKMKESLDNFLKEELDQELWKKLSARLTYRKIDMFNPGEYSLLEDALDQEARATVYYLAVPPDIYGNISQGLHTAQIVKKNSRVILEKPIGHDLDSSKVINDAVAEFFTEEQIYRIDHYLGKETVLNLIALRFANSIFTTNWDHNTIDHVQITVAEEVGIEGRWGYFDSSGQLRDMVQNHLLQILTFIAMEPPVNLSSESIRNEKLKVLKALRPITSDNIEDTTVRGQYASGFLKGGAVPGYLEEDDSHSHSATETFVAIRVDIDNWRWADVPFYLRTAKRMPKKLSEVVIYFKQLPHNIFKDSYKKLPRNKLIIRLQPDEGVEIQMLNKVPGISKVLRLQQNRLDLSFSEAFEGQRIADAYERLLLETMNGNQSLFVRRDEVEQAWTWIDSIQDAWENQNEPPKSYPAGSWGPVASVALLAKDGREWEE